MWRPFSSRLGASFISALMVIVVCACLSPVAWAGAGYQLDSTTPSIGLGAEIPSGVAVDQSSQEIYVAEGTHNLFNIDPGQLEQLSASGIPTANSPFTTGGQDFFVSVAVDPSTHGIYAYQIEGSTPYGERGASRLSGFSSAGALGASFSPPNAHAGALAVDASGRIYFPDNTSGSIRIYSPTGTQEGSVICNGCPGGGFNVPQSVAFDSSGNLYVVDSGGGGRVLKFTPSGGSYSYASTLQSERGAVAMAVDDSNGDVLVGDWGGGKYHVVAYDSSGNEFDDFGIGLATKSPIEAISGQLAVNATTHEVYLSNPGGRNLWAFERIASIPAPTAEQSAPSPVGQVTATLRTTVNPEGHVLTTCAFDYTEHADFLANGFDNAKTATCPMLIGNSESTVVSAAVSGLTPSTSYDYRVRIASHGGSAETEAQEFETLPPLPPESMTGQASALTMTSATLAGSVNPKGGTVSNCHFEYVTESAFQASGFTAPGSKNCSLIPSGNAATAVSAKISGLVAGTAYRFRLVVTNNSGTGTATDSSFTTVAETCAENPALCPAGGETQPSPAPPPVSLLPAPGNPLPPSQARKPLKCRKGFKKKKVHGKLKCVKVKQAHRH